MQHSTNMSEKKQDDNKRNQRSPKQKLKTSLKYKLIKKKICNGLAVCRMVIRGAAMAPLRQVS